MSDSSTTTAGRRGKQRAKGIDAGTDATTPEIGAELPSAGDGDKATLTFEVGGGNGEAPVPAAPLTDDQGNATLTIEIEDRRPAVLGPAPPPASKYGVIGTATRPTLNLLVVKFLMSRCGPTNVDLSIQLTASTTDARFTDRFDTRVMQQLEETVGPKLRQAAADYAGGKEAAVTFAQAKDARDALARQRDELRAKADRHAYRAKALVNGSDPAVKPAVGQSAAEAASAEWGLESEARDGVKQFDGLLEKADADLRDRAPAIRAEQQLAVMAVLNRLRDEARAKVTAAAVAAVEAALGDDLSAVVMAFELSEGSHWAAAAVDRYLTIGSRR